MIARGEPRMAIAAHDLQSSACSSSLPEPCPHSCCQILNNLRKKELMWGK